MNTPFWKQVQAAIKEGNADRVAELIGDDESKLTMSTLFGPWLHLAAALGQLDVAKRLVSMGVDINARGGISDGDALGRAASKGHLDIVEYLLSLGAELDVSEPERNPLFSAVYGGHLAVAELLIKSGLDPHVTYLGSGGRPKNALSFAYERGQEAIAEFLIAAGCSLPSRDGSDGDGEEAHRLLLSAVAAELGEVSQLALQEIVPVDDNVQIAVHVIRPDEHHPCVTLLTAGMSDKAMAVPQGQEEYQYAELLIHLPATWQLPGDSDWSDEDGWPISWLRQLAYYPHQTNTWLGGRYTIISNDEPPLPFAANTRLSCMLLIADLVDWSPVEINQDKRVHFYTLIPLYAEERDHVHQHGVHELLRRFEQHNVATIVDVSRVNVAAGPQEGRRNSQK